MGYYKKVAQNIWGTSGALKKIHRFDSNTKLLLHLNESPFVDSSVFKNSVGLYGSVARSATQSKFGGYSGYFNGTNQSIVVNHNFGLGINNFTVDCWFYWTSSTPYQPVFHLPKTGGYGNINLYTTRANINNHMVMQYNDGTGLVFPDSGITPTMNTWYHVAVIRNGNFLKLYVNGIERNSQTISTNLSFDNDSCMIGWEGANYYNGYIDEVRLSNVARWTANFTPPTSAYLI